MKKKLAVLSAGALAAAMCAGFVACGDGSSDLGIEENIPFSEIVSDKVTEKQWNDAFEIGEDYVPVMAKNYRYIYTTSYENEKSTFEISVDRNKAHLKLSDSEDEAYAEWFYKGGDGIRHSYGYFYTCENGVWSKGEDNNGAVYWQYAYAFDYSGVYEGGEDITEKKIRAFSDYTYSEEKKGYVCTNTDEEGEEYTPVIKFKDGKYCGYEWYNEDSYEGVIIYSYGTEKVTLPEVK